MLGDHGAGAGGGSGSLAARDGHAVLVDDNVKAVADNGGLQLAAHLHAARLQGIGQAVLGDHGAGGGGGGVAARDGHAVLVDDNMDAVADHGQLGLHAARLQLRGGQAVLGGGAGARRWGVGEGAGAGAAGERQRGHDGEQQRLGELQAGRGRGNTRGHWATEVSRTT